MENKLLGLVKIYWVMKGHTNIGAITDIFPIRNLLNREMVN